MTLDDMMQNKFAGEEMIAGPIMEGASTARISKIAQIASAPVCTHLHVADKLVPHLIKESRFRSYHELDYILELLSLEVPPGVILEIHNAIVAFAELKAQADADATALRMLGEKNAKPMPEPIGTTTTSAVAGSAVPVQLGRVGSP
jgi:hypothetical protein